MKKASDIKPIPKHILEKIRRLDHAEHPEQKGPTRLYSYLTSIKRELVKITLAVKTFNRKWYCKQIAVHGMKSKICWVKDMAHHRVAGYLIGWNPEGYKPHSYRRWADGEWESDDFARGIKWNPSSNVINLEYVGKFPEYKHSAYQYFRGVCIIDYLKTYLQYPQTEYLLKLDLCGLHNKVTILKQMDKDRQFCKWLATHRNELDRGQCYASSILKAYKIGRPVKQVQKMEEFKKTFKSNLNVPMLQELFGDNLESFYAYITEQNTDPFSYLDYLRACQYLRLDMSRPSNCFPKDFKKYHDRRINELSIMKARADEKQRKELYEKFTIVAEKYLALQNCKKGAYAILIAKSPKDLIDEGEWLNHCVGKMSYEVKMAKEETLIFFVRSIEKLDVPYVTVEYSLEQKKVLQCYGYDSKRPDESVLNFVNKVWLPYANRTIKAIAA
jgi:hypothetical protein